MITELIGKIGNFLTEHPIADRAAVNITAVGTSGGALTADVIMTSQQATEHLIFGISIVEWAAIFSITLVGITLLEKLFKWISTAIYYSQSEVVKNILDNQDKESKDG